MSKSIEEFGDYELADELRERGFAVDDDITQLEDYSDYELIDELDERGVYIPNDDAKDLIYSIWLKRRQGQEYQRELDSLIYSMIGKVI